MRPSLLLVLAQAAAAMSGEYLKTCNNFIWVNPRDDDFNDDESPTLTARCRKRGAEDLYGCSTVQLAGCVGNQDGVLVEWNE
jgi:hypothetical protein